MRITIFKTLRLRLKRWLGHVEFLGRARRQAARRLTLPDLEREVRAHMGVVLTANSRPPRFATLRYTFFGDRGLAPWVTERAVQAHYAKYHDNKTDGFAYLSVPYAFVGLSAFMMLAGVFAWQDASIISIVTLVGAVCPVLLTCLAFGDRWLDTRRYLKHASQGDICDASVPSVQSPMSAAIAQYVAQRLNEVKHGLIGPKTVHARTLAHAQAELQRALTLWERLRVRISRHTTAPEDLSAEMTDESVPEHLRVLYTQLRTVTARARETLEQLQTFEARVTAVLDELATEARTELVLYEDLDLIQEVDELDRSSRQTAHNVRRSIAQALDSLQERMEALREDVVRREELIGSIVAVLPSAPNRDAEWQRLEDVVSGLSLPPRQRTLA